MSIKIGYKVLSQCNGKLISVTTPSHDPNCMEYSTTTITNAPKGRPIFIFNCLYAALKFKILNGNCPVVYECAYVESKNPLEHIGSYLFINEYYEKNEKYSNFKYSPLPHTVFADSVLLLKEVQ